MSYESVARDFVTWTRAPGHDSYWYYRNAFFELLPPPGRRTLEVGCGEGRVSRDLFAREYAVTGLDVSPSLVAAAREAHPEGSYTVADAAELPFPESSFDLVVAYNSLMDLAEMPRSVAEIARVLEPGGRLCACVTHPLSDAGRFETSEPDAPFVVTGSYFGRREYSVTLERDGMRLSFSSSSAPLEHYARALEDAGFLLEAVREPTPTPDFRWYARRSRVPTFLLLRALKP